jgi:hypothetical protein
MDMEALPERWTLSLDASNLLRVTFGAARCGAVEVREALRGPRIVLRHDAEPYAFEMDGVPLAPSRPGAAWDRPFWTTSRAMRDALC